MALVLALVFRSRLRLLPLAVALGAVAITFGLMSLLGASLTMASIAVLPVLLGLGVDYAIQCQARASEEPTGGPPVRAARTARADDRDRRRWRPRVGFLVLLLSPVPMVRGFGVLLVVGIAIALCLRAQRRHRRAGGDRAGGAARRRAAGALGARRGRAGRRAWRARVGRPARAGAAARRPGAAAATVRGALRAAEAACCDRARARGRRAGRLDSQAKVDSDLRPARAAGPPRPCATSTRCRRRPASAGEIDVVVQGKDLTDPKVVAWMRDYQSGLLKRFGYTAKNGCGKAELCPALSLPDLFRDRRLGQERRRSIRALLGAVPPYFSQAVITADRTDGDARVRHPADAARAPEAGDRRDAPTRCARRPGVTARLAGLPVLAAEANAALSSPLRRLGTLLAGLLAVGARAARASTGAGTRAWVPLVPIALATGWSALVLFAAAASRSTRCRPRSARS